MSSSRSNRVSTSSPTFSSRSTAKQVSDYWQQTDITRKWLLKYDQTENQCLKLPNYFVKATFLTWLVASHLVQTEQAELKKWNEQEYSTVGRAAHDEAEVGANGCLLLYSLKPQGANVFVRKASQQQPANFIKDRWTLPCFTPSLLSLKSANVTCWFPAGLEDQRLPEAATAQPCGHREEHYLQIHDHSGKYLLTPSFHFGWELHKCQENRQCSRGFPHRFPTGRNKHLNPNPTYDCHLLLSDRNPPWDVDNGIEISPRPGYL